MIIIYDVILQVLIKPSVYRFQVRYKRQMERWWKGEIRGERREYGGLTDCTREAGSQIKKRTDGRTDGRTDDMKVVG